MTEVDRKRLTEDARRASDDLGQPDGSAQSAVEGRERPAPDDEGPVAGPHAKPDLQNEGATPGAGTLLGAGDETDATSS